MATGSDKYVRCTPLEYLYYDWKGRRGEKLTERELNLVKLMGRDGKVLRNVYIPKDNEETSELDVIFITQKGIFVFESKNYSGWIFGDDEAIQDILIKSAWC